VPENDSTGKMFKALLDEIDRFQNDVATDDLASTCCCLPFSQPSAPISSGRSLHADSATKLLGSESSLQVGADGGSGDESGVDASGSLRVLVLILTASTLILGLVWFALGVVFAIDETDAVSAGSDPHVLSYVLCSFGLVLFLVSLLGLIGVLKSRAAWLRSYSTFMSLLLFVEIIVYFVLFGHVSQLRNHSSFVAIICAGAAVLQLCASTMSCYYQSMIDTGAHHLPLSSGVTQSSRFLQSASGSGASGISQSTGYGAVLAMDGRRR
jgi:hypothetical protein